MKEFRFDIGLLRAIAVLIVILYHFKVPYFEGGFIGVDVFFVISGFLMTKILLSDLQNGTFDILGFYKRRVIRIIPPLLVTGLFFVFLSNMLFLSNEIQQNGKNILLSSLFVSNIYFWLYNNYFDPVSQNNIFLHSWSLSVEWQFYILYPLLLWPFKSFYNKNIKLFKSLFLALTLLSFLFCVYYTKIDNSFTFYMFPTRAWEMMLGGLAFLFVKDFNFLSNRVQIGLVIISYFVILICSVLINDLMTWPSWITLIPTLATFFILLFKVEFGCIRAKWVQFTGNISYELYLWHWPIYVTFIYFDFGSPINVFYMFIITLLISTAAYYGVEKSRKVSSLKGAFILFLAVTPVALYSYKTSDNKLNDNLSIYKKDIKELNRYMTNYSRKERKKQFNSCNCFQTTQAGYSLYDESKCLKIDMSKKNIILLGDSHSAQYSLSIREKLAEKYNVMETSFSVAFPFPDTRGRKESVDLVQKFYKFVDENSTKIDKVIISVHWLMRLTPELNYTEQEIKVKILEMLQYFDEKEIEVVFFGQTEQYDKAFSKILLLNYLFDDNSFESKIDPASKRMNIFLKSFIPDKNYVDIYNLPSIIKYDKKNYVPYMTDNNHLTKYGADQIIEYVINQKRL